MNDPILIDLVIAEPILLDLVLAPEYYVGTSQAGPQGEKGDKGDKGDVGTILFGDKISYVDAGEIGWISLGDDYAYFCIETGTAETILGANDGTAVWKKTPLFKSI